MISKLYKTAHLNLKLQGRNEISRIVGTFRFGSDYSTTKTILEEKGNFHVHFKVSGRPHPLGVSTNLGVAVLGDHTGLQQNHIWTPEELKEKMKDLHRHKPQTIADHVMNKLVNLSIVCFKY